MKTIVLKDRDPAACKSCFHEALTGKATTEHACGRAPHFACSMCNDGKDREHSPATCRHTVQVGVEADCAEPAASQLFIVERRAPMDKKRVTVERFATAADSANQAIARVREVHPPESTDAKWSAEPCADPYVGLGMEVEQGKGSRR